MAGEAAVMPYAFLNPDGTIKMVVPKPTPYMRA
jgi:hypothetical protein